MTKGGIPLGVWSGSDATKELHETIKLFVDRSEKQACTMIRLTRAIVWLTVGIAVLTAVMAGLVFIQISSATSS